jgi:acyl-coenzyme A synthetase/AMP-(fatty) acid ligase
MADLPLLRNHGTGAVIAYQGKHPVGLDEFLGHVARLAAVLPDRDYVLNLCADRYHFAVAFAAALVRAHVSLLPPNVVTGAIADLACSYPDVYCLGDGAAEAAGLDTLSVPDFLSGETAAVRMISAIPEARCAAILFTSGSTGRPMPHAKSWGSLVTGALGEAQRLGLAAGSGMSVLATVPPQHMYGLESTVLLPMQNGFALHAARPFFPADICAELETLRRPRALVTTPFHLRALLAEAADVPPVDFVLCATAPLSPQLAAEAEARFSAPLHEIYGCTEAGQVGARRTVAGPEWQAHPGVTLRQDERGTWASGGHVEAEVLLADVIELHEAGNFVLHGRTADLVNIAGKRTSLAHLNYHLNSIEGVRDGAFVMPAEDGRQVTRLVAFVVAPGLSSETIMNALRQRIDPAFLPRPLQFVEALPRNATGKLPRQAFSELIAAAARKAG